jgi:hypothetical protein
MIIFIKQWNWQESCTYSCSISVAGVGAVKAVLSTTLLHPTSVTVIKHKPLIRLSWPMLTETVHLTIMFSNQRSMRMQCIISSYHRINSLLASVRTSSITHSACAR